jgi:5-methylcytosine-specific restriction endonuclease McrA
MNAKQRKNLIKRLDKDFSLRVRLRDGQCIRCGSKEMLQCSHVVSRKYMHTRWELTNAVTLCYRCHMHFWHTEPHEAVKWFDSLYPGRYDELRQLANKMEKVDLDEIYHKIKI